MSARKRITVAFLAICLALAILTTALFRYGYYIIFDESAYAYCPDEEITENGRTVISGPRPRFFPKSDPQQIGWWGNEWYFDFYRDQIRAFCIREGCEWPRDVGKEFGNVYPVGDIERISPQSLNSQGAQRAAPEQPLPATRFR